MDLVSKSAARRPAAGRLGAVSHGVALFLILAVTELLVLYTALAFAGILPWPEISADGGASPKGQWALITVTSAMVLVTLLAPGGFRLVRQGARRAEGGGFGLNLPDPTRLPRIDVDESDDAPGLPEFIKRRRGAPDERDELRSRIALAHARGSLEQRQCEVTDLRDNVAEARQLCDELRRWHQTIRDEEALAETELGALEGDLREVLPLIGYELEEPRDNVVQMPRPKF